MTMDAMNSATPLPSLQNISTADEFLYGVNTTTANNTSPLTSSLFLPCNNPRNVLSPFVAETVELVVYAGIFPVLVTCGVITNVINMAVFARQKLSDRIHLCLFSLAVADTGFLLFVMCAKAYVLVSLVDSTWGNYWQQRYAGTVLGSYLGFLITSNMLTALLAIERCLCVLSPLQAARFFRTTTMAVMIVVIGVYALVVKNVALSLKYLTVQVNDPLTNTSTFISRLSPFYLRHRTIIDIVYSDLLSIAVPVLSLIVVIVCTIVTSLRLRVASAWRHQAASKTSSEGQEAAVTRMLVLVCCVYVVCMTPSVTRTWLLHRLPGFLISGHLCNVVKVCTAMVQILEVLNASVNFLIYVQQSSRYRATLRQLCARGSGRTTKAARSLESLASISRDARQGTAKRSIACTTKNAESPHM